MSFNFDLVVRSFPLLLTGAAVTVEITVLSVGFGLLIGMFVGIGKATVGVIENRAANFDGFLEEALQQRGKIHDERVGGDFQENLVELHIGGEVFFGGFHFLQPPHRFFEMTLTRIGDSDWPEAGAATAP